MEIEITALLEQDMFEFSHSAHEGGQDAGRNTWRNTWRNATADAEGREPPLLQTEEQLSEFRDDMRSTGGWAREEIDGWDATHCNALFLQLIAGAVRECPAVLEEASILPSSRNPGMWCYDRMVDGYLQREAFDSYDAAYTAASDELVGMYQTRRAESLDEIDWLAYEEDSKAGRIAGRMFRTDDGRVYYYLGS